LRAQINPFKLQAQNYVIQGLRYVLVLTMLILLGALFVYKTENTSVCAY